MSNDSPIVVKKRETFSQQNSQTQIELDPILDTRYQSFLRFYINDILNADTTYFNESIQNSNNRGHIKINNTLLYKVTICGLIVGIYDSEKYYRLKIDDSTGCINVTVWKSSLYNEDSSNLISNSNICSNFSELYEMLNSIQSRIKEKSINNSIMYEPKQGDLVLIRGHIKCFRQRIDINALTCSRIQNSNEELIQMILPSILYQKVYSIPTPSMDEFDLATKLNHSCQNTNKPLEHSNKNIFNHIQDHPKEVSLKEKDNLLNFVHKKLIELSSKMINESCSSYSVYNFLRNNCPVEFKCITLKQVLNALKELETRGLIYSCEDEFHYMPMS